MHYFIHSVIHNRVLYGKKLDAVNPMLHKPIGAKTAKIKCFKLLYRKNCI